MSSKLKPRCTNSGEIERGGYSKCHKKCDLCQNFSQETNTIRSQVTGRLYNIKQNLTCTSSNVIYLVTCLKCKLQYVGSTSTPFKVRFRNHKSSMVTNKKTCEVAVHFGRTPHELSDFEFTPFEKIIDAQNTERKLLTREVYWTAQLRTLQPYGLNKRQELHSMKRISYTS